MTTTNDDNTFAREVAALNAKFKTDMARLADELPPELRDQPLTDEDLTAFARAFKQALARTDKSGGTS